MRWLWQACNWTCLWMVLLGPADTSHTATLVGQGPQTKGFTISLPCTNFMAVAGAHVVAFTSQAPSQLQVPADLVVQVPATCLPAAEPHGDGGRQAEGCAHEECPAGEAAAGRAGCSGEPPALPMGSSYELALQLLFDVLCILLQRATGIPEAAMRQRHTNME
jgi:hypothetical protein